MNRQTLSIAGVVALVLLAGTVPLAGATVSNGHQDAAGTPAASSAQQDAGTGTDQVNGTIDTLELRDVTFTNVVVEHVHVTGTVTAGDETTLETGDESETVENITARQLHVANATLENVSVTNLTVRDDSLATSLLGNRTADGDGLNASSATLENRTIDGVAIEHGTLGDADVAEIRHQRADSVDTESDEPMQGDAAIEIYSASVDNATVGDASSVDLSIGNEPVADGATEDGDES